MTQAPHLRGSPDVIKIIDGILDKDRVIDGWARFSLAGIELLSVERRIVTSSVETYFHLILDDKDHIFFPKA